MGTTYNNIVFEIINKKLYSNSGAGISEATRPGPRFWFILSRNFQTAG